MSEVNIITMFIAFSAIVTMSSEVVKKLIKLKKPEWQVGLPLAIVFGLSVSLTYGTGLLSGIFGVNYDTAWCVLGFRFVDLVMSGLIYALSSNAIIALKNGKNVETDTSTVTPTTVVNSTVVKEVAEKLEEVVEEMKEEVVLEEVVVTEEVETK